MNNVLITGGAGYVGAVLVPKLLKKGYRVTVLDWYLYGNVLEKHPNLREMKGDLRDKKTVKDALKGVDAVIHLACISNDPSFELDSTLGKSVNYDAGIQLFELSKKAGVQRFIYASSSSVYGVRKEKEVTEDLPLEPLTDYSKYKAQCEEYYLSALNQESRIRHQGRQKNKTGDASSGIPKNFSGNFLGLASGRTRQLDNSQMTTLILRPATVCGYSPRMRLDLTVNMLTVQALVNKKITVFGGSQMRPNIHIGDMTDLYVKSLEYPHEKIHRKIFNAGYDNYTVGDIARMVKETIGDKKIEIVTTPTNDNRSYHVSSKKIAKELGFTAKRTVVDAIRDIVEAYRAGKLPDPLTNPVYFNIKMMQQQHIQ